MKNQLANLIENCLNKLKLPSDNIMVTLPKHPSHGDFSSNIAKILSGKLNKAPMEIAATISNQLELIR